jgi:hypothetical protein
VSVRPRIETEEDLRIIKEYTLLPILLDMLARDIDELQINQNKIVFNHVIFYLKVVEKLIFEEMQIARNMMKKLDIKILTTDMNVKGIEVEYKVRGYLHCFYMLRSLVKSELMTMLLNLGKRIVIRKNLPYKDVSISAFCYDSTMHPYCFSTLPNRMEDLLIH